MNARLKDLSPFGLNAAAEYAVASELSKLGLKVQVRYQKYSVIDLILEDDSGEEFRVEVKAKRAEEWPNCNGISQNNEILVLVDYQEKGIHEVPDFYILTLQDWDNYVQRRVADFPHKRFEIVDHVPVWLDEITSEGKLYRGMGVLPGLISNHRDRWDKILGAS